MEQLTESQKVNAQLVDAVLREFRPYAQKVHRDYWRHPSDVIYYSDGFRFWWHHCYPGHFDQGTGNAGHIAFTMHKDGEYHVEVGVNGAFLMPTANSVGFVPAEMREMEREEVLGIIDGAYTLLARDVARRTLLDVAVRLRDKAAGFKQLKRITDLARELDAT